MTACSSRNACGEEKQQDKIKPGFKPDFVASGCRCIFFDLSSHIIDRDCKYSGVTQLSELADG